MNNLIYVVGFFAFLLSSTQALNCRNGHEIYSELLTDTQMNSVECPTNAGPQSCLKMEGIIVIFSEYYGRYLYLL